MKHESTGSSQKGMTLVEVIVASALFTLASLAAAHLLVWATRALWSTRAQTVALAAAQAKMEELQSLAWHFDDAVNRVSDVETNLTGRSAAGGGPGLSPSPPDTLRENVDGYVDYLDAHGAWAGAGITPPADVAFVRRWAVRPLVSAPEDTLVLEVLVIPIGTARSGATASGQNTGQSRLISARTRVR